MRRALVKLHLWLGLMLFSSVAMCLNRLAAPTPAE